MKTVKIFLSAAALVLINLTSVNANETYPDKICSEVLSEKFSSILYYLPYEDLLDKNEESLLSISFKVNENHELDNIQIMGDNPQIVKYAQTKLTNRVIKVDRKVKEREYNIKFHYMIK